MVVPCYDDGRLLVEAVGSIDEPEPVDVLVVDDGSTDPATTEVLDRLADEGGVRVVHHEENRGLAAARNTGLEGARTRYLFPLDADDLAVAGALSAMADRLDADPGLAVCYGDYLEFGSYELIRAVPLELDPYRLAYVNEYPVSSLFRRSDLVSLGGWRKLAPYEDWNLWLTLAEHGCRGAHLGPGRLTYRRRLHGDRMLTSAKRSHRVHYGWIRAAHPAIFEDIGRHRRASGLALHRKLLYPMVYGSRPRFAFEQSMKRLLDRTRIWTLRR